MVEDIGREEEDLKRKRKNRSEGKGKERKNRGRGGLIRKRRGVWKNRKNIVYNSIVYV